MCRFVRNLTQDAIAIFKDQLFVNEWKHVETYGDVEDTFNWFLYYLIGDFYSYLFIIITFDSKIKRSRISMDYSNMIIKDIVYVILQPLVFIDNKCVLISDNKGVLEQDTFSNILKITKVIPGYKKRQKTLFTTNPVRPSKGF